MFLEWIARHQRDYKTEEEYAERRQIFEDNLKTIDNLNRKHEGNATFGLTKFSDMTLQEFK